VAVIDWLPVADWAGRPWLERRAELTPAAEALLCDGELLDYRALQLRALGLSEALGALGISAGVRVAVAMENGIPLAVLFHALRAQGAVLIPLNTRCTAVELSFQLRDAGASWLIHAPGEMARLAAAAAADAPGVARAALDVRGALSPLGNVDARRRQPSSDDPQLRVDDAIAILYTSGTTGRPKGAVLGPESFLASAEGSARLLGAAPEDRWLACLPLFHVGGLSILVRSCLAGSAAVIQRGFDPHAVSACMDEERITLVSLVASMLSRVLDARGTKPAPASLRCVLLGGGATPESLLQRAQGLGFPVAPTYGLSEAASQVATRPPQDGEAPLDGRLQPLPGNLLRIIDSDGAVVDAGTVGEICVRGPTLMRGYLGSVEASERVLRGGWLHTGDLGQLDAEGRLRVLDRRDDLIVSGGENIYPAELEAVLGSHSMVSEAGVRGEPDDRFGMRPVAWWVAVEGCAEAPDLEAFCRERLAGFKVPVAFHRVSELPRNAAGKLLRRALGSAAPDPG
jgi:O-succinylbenzoic acid--CoA ligase